MMGLYLSDDSPANAEAAQLYRENMKEYVRRVKVSRIEGLDVFRRVDLGWERS
jgi:ubiquitin-protein ligase